jgi:porphobilinogen synthase
MGLREAGDASQATLAKGRIARHPVWSRALGRPEVAARLVLPVIVSGAVEDRERVDGTAGLERLSITELVREARGAASAGLAGLLIFGASDRKDELALLASQRDHIVPRAVRAVKEAVPELAVVTDVCVCTYVSHGQCVLFGAGGADVAGTLERLAEIAQVHADAGADLLIPSGMLDGAAAAVRAALRSEHDDLPVAAMAEIESSLDATHRLAVGAVPISERAVPLLSAEDQVAVGARARRELEAGADAIVIRPGAPALDLVQVVASRTDRPVFAFHTADEHAAFAMSELIDGERAEREIVAASRRAGATFVITYAARSIAEA